MSSTEEKRTGCTEQMLERFANILIQKMEALKASGKGWDKPWIDGSFADIPRNVVGRPYSGSNSLFLMLYAAEKGWKSTVFLTFNQAHEYGAMVRKGEKAFPVGYWNISIKDADGKRISEKDYKAMTEEQRNKCKVTPYLKVYKVFNIDQTTFAEVKPELYARIMAKYVPSIASDANGMYANAAIDRMIGNQEWICPVQSDKLSDSAYYSPTRDTIVVPEKRQFNKGGSTEEVFTAGQRFYGTLLHEMAHSTGHKSRLNRLEKAAFGDEKYAKEELVAELSSALASQVMGFSSCLSDNNASYLNSWIEALGREPKFIVSVMADVNKASNMIFAQIDRQRIALGEEPYVSMGNEKSYSKAFEPSDASQVAKTTAVAARGYDAQLIARDADGSLIGVRPLTTGETKVWHSLDSFEEKETMTRALVGNHFSKELSECSRRMGQQQHKGMKL